MEKRTKGIVYLIIAMIFLIISTVSHFISKQNKDNSSSKRYYIRIF